MEIHQNLKRCRLALGLTQEQAAEQLHTTRQTVSNYETGRSQPDLDTLARLAGLYGVPPECLLYGDREERKLRRLKQGAWIVVACRLFLLMLTSASMWAANHWLPVPPSFSKEDEAYAVFQLRMSVSHAYEGADALASAAFFVALLVLLFLDLSLRMPQKLRDRVILFLVLAGGSLVLSLPWGLFDPIFGTGNYRINALGVIITALPILLIDLAVRAVRTWRRRREL